MKEYELIPYPRKLWVEIMSDETLEKIIEEFEYNIDDEDERIIKKNHFNQKGASTCNVENKDTGMFGVIVLFSPAKFEAKTFAHEAFLVVDFLVDSLGLDYVKNTGNEHIAYMIEHVVSLFEDYFNEVIMKNE